jgi:cytochrome c553
MMKRLIMTLCICCAVTGVQAAGNPAAGKDKAAVCAGCHGADGNSPTPMFPKIAGQYENYLVHALKAYKSGERKNPIMAGMAAPLSDQDIADLAAFFSRQKGLHDTPASRLTKSDPGP